MYKALTYINLPVVDIKKAPGDKITENEFKSAGQTKENIQELIDGGSISTDLDAELHPDNRPVAVPVNESADVNVHAGDSGKGTAKAK